MDARHLPPGQPGTRRHEAGGRVEPLHASLSRLRYGRRCSIVYETDDGGAGWIVGTVVELGRQRVCVDAADGIVEIALSRIVSVVAAERAKAVGSRIEPPRQDTRRTHAFAVAGDRPHGV